MALGDHWDEPARCRRCGQPYGTHDDGECEATRRSMMFPAKPKAKKPETALEAFQREGEPNGGNRTEGNS